MVEEPCSLINFSMYVKGHIASNPFIKFLKQKAGEKQHVGCASRINLNIVVRFWISDAGHGSGENIHVSLLYVFAAVCGKIVQSNDRAVWRKSGTHKRSPVKFLGGLTTHQIFHLCIDVLQ